MKELMKKITVILVLMMMLINSSLLLSISDAIDAIEEVMDEAKINPLYEINLEKYVNYNTEGSTGTVVQINLKTGIEYGEGQEYKPLNSTGVLLNLPKIEDEYPESIEVVGKSTKATNGSDVAKDFKQFYNKDTGEMKVVAINPKDDSGNIYSENVEGARDEYTIICYYSSNCYNDKNDERKLEFSGFVQANIANDTEIKKDTEITQNYIVTENISGLVSTTVKTTDIYNGYIKSNSQNGTNYATEYTENLEINISKKDLSDEVKIDTTHNFIDKNNKEIETDEIVYKSTRINKNEVLDMLGEDGYLQILNEKGDVLGEVNKDTFVGENNIYELTYENELNKVIVKTSKPLKVGTIILQNTKKIKETMTDIQNSRIQVKYNISCSNNIQEKDEETEEVIKEIQKEIYNFSDESVIDIKDSVTRVDLAVDNQEWTNNMQNEINFTTTLVTDSPQYNLFKNPVIEIKLPSEVEKVVLGDATLLNSCNLSTDVNTELVENGDNKIIRVQLTGTQTEYSTNGVYEGPYVVIPATIIMKKDMNSNYANIEYSYINEGGMINDYTLEGKESKQLTIAEKTMNQVVVTSLEENSENVALLSTSEQITEGIEVTLQAQVGNRVLNDGDSVYEKQVIKYTVTAKNTLGKNVSGINIVGKVPEGTTFATVDIGTYDEENYEYIKDGSVTEYVVPITELAASQTKTEYYEVVVNDLNAETEKSIQNTINTKINNYQYSTQTISNTIKKAELNVQLISYIGRAEKSEFCYHIYVTNMTSEALTNIDVATTEFPSVMKIKTSEDGKISAKYLDSEITEISDFEYEDKFEDNKYKAKIKNIDAGKTIAIEIKVLVGNFEYGINEYELSMVAMASSENTQTYESNENRRTAYPEYVTISQEVLDEKVNNIDGQFVNADSEVTYKLHIKNESKIKTTINIQDFFNEKLENIEATCTTYELKEFAEEMTANDTKYDLNQEANAEYELHEQSISVSSQENEFNLITTIPAGKTLDITVKAEVGEEQNYTPITNYFTVSGEYIKTLDSNITKFYVMPNYSDIDDPDDIYDFDKDDGKIDINPEEPEKPEKPEKPENPENPDNPDITDDFNISGTVWIDKNKDGLKQEDEEKISNVNVKLYNATTNSIEIDANNNKQITTTDENGKYYFNNIKKGNYLVLFEYDIENYTITKYQSSLASSTNNSDATQKEVSIDGVVETVAVTDILEINNESLENIDLGLIANKKLDLSLEKYVTKITVENASGTKEYKYNNSKLAKVEIPAKQLEGSIVTIEYKIVITNEGDTSAYVSEIIDYLPEGASIKNTNQNWIKKSDGNAICSGLSGKEIREGESKEVTLEVSKEINSDNIGTIVNYAEIGRISNLEGLKDIDSEEANKNPDEDDFSEATVIISIKTGLVRNIFIICVLLISIALILYFVKTKNKKIMLLAMICLLGLGVTNIGIAYKEDSDETNYDIHIVYENGVRKFRARDHQLYFTCIDPGRQQCSGGHHYYEYYGYDSEVSSSITHDSHAGAKVKIINLEQDKDSSDAEKLYFKCEFETNESGYNFSSYTATVTYTSSESGGKATDKNVTIVTKNETRIGGKFEFSIKDLNAENVTVTIKLTYEDAIKTTKKSKKTMYYWCTGVSNGNHTRKSGRDCKISSSKDSNNTGVQRMKRSKTEEKETVTNKKISASKTVKTDPVYGKIKIIKYDKDTGKVLKTDDSTGEVRFIVYYIDSDNRKQYVCRDDKGNLTTSTSKKELKIGNDGTYTIKKVDLNKKYYFEETKSYNKLYTLPSKEVELDVMEYNVSNVTAGRRATEYAFTRKNVQKLLLKKVKNSETGLLKSEEDRKKYIDCIYDFLMEKFIRDDDIQSNDRYLRALYIHDRDVIIENGSWSKVETPTQADIITAVRVAFKYVGRYKDIIDTGKTPHYADKLEDYLKTTNLFYEYQKKTINAYLAKGTPNIISNQKESCSLQIVKYDADDIETMLNASFTIQYNGTVDNIKNPYVNGNGELSDSRQDVKTSSGIIKIDHIPVGKYTIKEVIAPKGYELELQKNNSATISIDRSSTSTNPKIVEFYNKQYGNLQIEKIDKDTGNTINSKGFGFKIYYYEDNNKKNGKKYIGTNCSVSDVNKVSKLDIQTSDTKAKEFLTDATGKTQIIYNLPINVTYYIEEVTVPKDSYYERSKEVVDIKLKPNKTSTGTFTTTAKFKNKQKYVDISGYVWEDKVDNSKNTLRDDLYDEAEETRVKDITVKLKVREKVKNSDKETIKTISETTTDKDGKYKFTRIAEIKNLSNYYVEFEYNGLKYQSVSKNLKEPRGSKATEKDDDRTHFNNLYAEITGGNEKGTNTKGYSKNESGKTTNVLTYKNGTYSSSLIENTGYNVSSANGSVTPQVYEGGGLSQGVTMRANTATAGYTFKLPEEGTEIINVNFGLYERAQPDISIATDLYTLDLSINGYSQTYTYNSRDKKSDINIYSELQKWNKTDEEMTKENDKYPRSYTRGIYKNYVYASGVDGEGSLSDENKLKVDLKYKILIKNESSLYMSANEIVNYFDNSLNYVNSYYQNDDGQYVNIKWETKEDKNGKKQLRTTALKDIKIPPNSSLCVYMVMRKNNVLKWKDEEKLDDETHSISEIASYSNYTKNADNTYSYYAGIDMDSAPDNIKPDDVSTYEDDTDSAPVLKITFLEPKTISGYVFEDKTQEDLNTGEERSGERKGDGKYNANEDGYVAGVTVELIDESSKNDAYIYPNSVKADKAIYTTKKEKRGYYEFVGIIPNKYYLKFTYGDGTIIYRNSGESSVNVTTESSVNVTTESYKSTIITSNVVKSAYENVETPIGKPKWYLDEDMKEYSTAVDDLGTRKKINDKLRNITYGSKSEYENGEKGYYKDFQKISAKTPEIEIFVEDCEHGFGYNTESGVSVYDNINFGIVERPRQSIEVNKEISYIKLILTNGQALVEGNPREGTLPYVKTPKGGGLTIEVDNEIIEGATLEVTYEIKIKNNSELDYGTDEYYIYGTNSQKSEPISMTIKSIVDYMDENLKTTYKAEDGQWKLMKLNELKRNNLVSSSVKSNNILVNNCNIELKPGEEGKINVNASKLLSTANDMNYENYVEVLKASNEVGRFYGQRDETSGKWKLISPGSLVIGNEKTYEIDDSKAKLNIIPPTGENKNMIIYTIVGISCLSMVVVGIILIKKKVLD